jgi:long-chain acyl-CoA synthetase
VPDRPRENLLSLFREFERFRNHIAVVQKRGYRRETWTYGRLAASAKEFAISLKERGVKTGERVLLWGPNSAEWVAAFWGCLLCGAVAVPMDEGASEDFVSRAARNADVRMVVTTNERMAVAVRILGSEVQVVDQNDIGARVSRSEVRDAENYQSFSDVPVKRSDIAQILFTSGTTSEPRGVVLTHGNFLANLQPVEQGIAAYGKYERWFHPLRFVTLVPLSHVFGQFMALLVPPLLGAAVVFEASANPNDIVRTIKKERATALVAVPRMVKALRAGMERDIAAARSQGEKFARAWKAAEGKKFLRRVWIFRGIHRRFGWKFWAFISGGAALAARDEEFFNRLGYAVVQGYGMTETASLISLNHPFRAAAGSIGKILPGREFRLADDGEILVRGENVSAGYWEGGAMRASDGAGWLHTGDIGELDSEGNLHFRGRKKNVLVTAAGLNVYPEDLEAALRKQPAVRDAVVVGVEREGNAEACAVLLLDEAKIAGRQSVEKSNGAGAKPGQHGEAAARAAINEANSSLAEYQRIQTWLIWPDPDFPRTATGKPRLAEIAAGVTRIFDDAAGGATDGDDARRGTARSPRANESVDQLVRRFAGQAGAGESSSTALESELGMSSLDRVELMSALEEKFHVELDETAFAKARNVEEIEALLKQPAAQRSEYSYPAWAQTWPVRWLRLAVYYLVVWPVTMILAHPKVVGRENLRTVRGPVLVVSNHVTRRSDIGLILAALPQRYRNNLAAAMGGETLLMMRRPPGDWFFIRRWGYELGYWLVTALFNVFPLPQRSGFRGSFRFAGESVDRGYSILVFPEGEVTRDGQMAEFQGGIGLLAENLGLAVVPMRMDGVWNMKREHRRLAKPGEITVHIGAPMCFAAGTDPQSTADALRAAVLGLGT